LKLLTLYDLLNTVTWFVKFYDNINDSL